MFFSIKPNNNLPNNPGFIKTQADISRFRETLKNSVQYRFWQIQPADGTYPFQKQTSFIKDS